MGKVIHPKKHVETMFRSIKEHSKHGHIERIFSDQRRCHYTDGVIFAPDEPYHLKATPNFFKWKYTDKQTVDFRVVLKSGGLREVDLYIGTETGEMLVKPVQLKEHDWMRLNRDIRAAAANSPNAPTIAEWAYEPWSGTWKYHFLRPDKNKPNFIRIFHETMESIAESIPAHEIIKRLTLTPETDRFEAHLRAKATLLGTGQPQQQQQQQQHRQHRHPSQQHQHHHQHQGGQGHYAPPAGGPPANANGHQAPEEPGYYTEALPE
jgi:mRNA guanylyltransferase